MGPTDGTLAAVPLVPRVPPLWTALGLVADLHPWPPFEFLTLEAGSHCVAEAGPTLQSSCLHHMPASVDSEPQWALHSGRGTLWECHGAKGLVQSLVLGALGVPVRGCLSSLLASSQLSPCMLNEFLCGHSCCPAPWPMALAGIPDPIPRVLGLGGGHFSAPGACVTGVHCTPLQEQAELL